MTIKFNVQNDNWLVNKPIGTQIALRVQVGHENLTGFSLVLTLPIRVGGSERLPLKPHFIYFEDPEHNRRLTSIAQQATKDFTVNQNEEAKNYILTLSTDREQYNANSELYLLYNLNDLTPNSLGGNGKLQQTRIRGSVRDKYDPINNLVPSTLYHLSLVDYELAQGDLLEFKLSYTYKLGTESYTREVVLQVSIVAEPVEIVPQAAYALLCKHNSSVECARFAWQPTPNRTELLNPEDLKNGVVRRRAIFTWQHVTSSQDDVRYAIQKITLQGATHFPDFE